LLTSLRLTRNPIPHAALAAMYGVHRSTVTRAVTEVRPLLAGRGYATPHGPRLHTLADVLAYAAAHGIRLCIDGSEITVRRPAAGRPGRRAFVSGKKKASTIKFTKISDGRGRTLWDGAFRPGRMHDQTVRTEGIDALLDHSPDVEAELDAGYRGLRRDYPGQVYTCRPSSPPRTPPPTWSGPGTRPVTPSPPAGSAWSTPSPARRTGGSCNAGSAAASTSPRQSWRSARWYPTAPPPGDARLHADHASDPGKDGPNLTAHLLVKPM
jgi:hypothetical protein